MTDARIIRFDGFEVDTAALELRRDGQRIAVSPQAVRALLVLTSSAGRLVTREQLYETIWPDPDVDVDRGLNTLIRQLRIALGDDVSDPAFIRTYPRRGYRFLQDVETLELDAAVESRTNVDVVPPPAHRRPPILFAKAAAFAGIVVATVFVTSVIRRADARLENAAAATGKDAHDAPGGTAREPFLMAKHLLEQTDIGRRAEAVPYLEQAVAAAPRSAVALAWLSDALFWANRWTDARTAAARALAIDPHAARALLVRGTLTLVQDWDRDAAERDLRDAVRSSPADPAYHHGLAFVLATGGQLREAIAELKRARELDPVSSIVTGDLGLIYLYAGRFDDAAAMCRRALDLEPGAAWAIECAFDSLAHLGRYEQARPHAAAILRASGESPDAVLGGATGDARIAVKRFREWRARNASSALANGQGSAYTAALAFVEAGRRGDALDALRLAAAERGFGFVTITIDPRFRPLWTEPEFQTIAEKLTSGGFAPIRS